MPKTVEVPINPEVLKWAINSSDYEQHELFQTTKYLDKWLKGEKKPTLVQLGNFSKKIRIPFGYLLAKEPPEQIQTYTDYRTIKNSPIKKPSRGLIETINDMEFKISWMRDYRISIGAEEISAIGMFSKRKYGISEMVSQIRVLLKLENDWAFHTGSFNEAYNLLKERIESLGVLVMKDALVLGNTHRRLDINEFRAFILYDDYAPLIFLNGQDSKAGRIFSLLHEFCHLLMSKEDNIIVDPDNTEDLCNQVAARFLMPKEVLFYLLESIDDIDSEIDILANKFKVSPLALARILYSLKVITLERYEQVYENSIKNYKLSKSNKGEGGNHYATKRSNLSTEFTKAVLISAGEGKTLYSNAYKLLNVSNSKTFEELTKGY